MTQITIGKPSSALWTATFNNPPINLIDPDTIDELAGTAHRAGKRYRG